MSIDVSWCDQKKNIIMWKVGETWTLDDYYQAYEKTKMRLLSSNQTGHLIVDAIAPIEPPRPGLLPHFLKVLMDIELDILVYVDIDDDPPIVQQLLDLLMRTNRSIQVNQLKFMDSVDDAIEYISNASTGK